MTGLPVVAETVDFNIDVLDIEDRKNINLSSFRQAGYVMPGKYLLTIRLNGHEIAEQDIVFRTMPDRADSSEACLPPELVGKFGLKSQAEKELRWTTGDCLDTSSLEGITAEADLSQSSLEIGLPQIYVEYTDANWDPPSRWDEGINGGMVDYSLNATGGRSRSGSLKSLTGNGTAGLNAGAWRFRGDWQLQNMLETGDSNRQSRFSWSRYYAFRAIKDWKSRLTLGEDYLTSDIFDSFRYAGVSLRTDENMLPPSLRGYAPEINGVADSNATVRVSQQGRVIYETQVAPGPFSIQDLSSWVSGTLDVEIVEQDGKVRHFQVSTATIPYLTRPGSVQYKLTSGRTTDWEHNADGPVFAAGEASWGITNGWSLYGGAMFSEGYQLMSVGAGRDLYQLGAISADVSVSRSILPTGKKEQGKSFRLSYAKRFDEINSQVNFAGYRFSEESFHSMSDYLALNRASGSMLSNEKERYLVSVGKQFSDAGINASLNYNHQTWWHRPDTDRFDMTLSTTFAVGSVRNISASVRGYRQTYYGRKDDGISLQISLPWGEKSYLGYSATANSGQTQHALNYSGYRNRDSWNASAVAQRNGQNLSGFYSARGDRADLSLSALAGSGNNLSAGASLHGGLTITGQGSAFHGAGAPGAGRILIDTSGVSGVPLSGGGGETRSNSAGKAVLVGAGNYYRTQARIDLDRMGDDMEASDSTTQMTLTEGAIGYRKMSVVSGVKGMVQIRMKDGSVPPFGGVVTNRDGKETGMVGEAGATWLSGMNSNEKMYLRLSGDQQCVISLPEDLVSPEGNSLLLVCEPTSAASVSSQL